MSSCPKMTRRQKSETTSVRKLLEQLENPLPWKGRPKPLKPELDVEYIRSQMKSKWKGKNQYNLRSRLLQL